MLHSLDQTLGMQETEYDLNIPGEAESEYGGPGEMETLEMASELLGVSNEQDLENFLGDLINKAGSAISNFAKSSTGQALGGILKSAAKAALPIAGSALGGVIGGPAGAAIGGKLAGTAGQLFGLELEGLSYEDQEFEVAQQVVRLANDAAAIAAANHGTAPPVAVARDAFVQAAQTHAPGMIRPVNGSGVPSGAASSAAQAAVAMGGRRSGRWHRRGDKIVLIGV